MEMEMQKQVLEIDDRAELERDFLTSALVYDDGFAEMRYVEPGWFTDPRHEAMFTAMKDLDAGGRPIEARALLEQLQIDDVRDRTDAAAYIARITGTRTCRATLPHYVGLLKPAGGGE